MTGRGPKDPVNRIGAATSTTRPTRGPTPPTRLPRRALLAVVVAGAVAQHQLWPRTHDPVPTPKSPPTPAAPAGTKAPRPRVLFVSSAGSDSHDGSTLDLAKATLQAAHDALPPAGGQITIRSGDTLLVAGSTSFSKPIVLIGTLVTVQAAAPTFNLLRLLGGSSGSRIEGLSFRGAATTDQTSQFAIAGDPSSPVSGVTIRNCSFVSGTSTPHLNSGVKVAAGCNDWAIDRCHFAGLVGSRSGVGYGVLVGAASRCRVTGSTLAGAFGRGRHGVYLSAGASFSQISGNTFAGFNEAAISVYAFARQPACTSNTITGNTINGAAMNVTPDSASIQVNGNCHDNQVTGNIVQASGAHGILVSGAGQGPTNVGNRVANNQIVASRWAGIAVLGAQRTRVENNQIRAAVQTPPGRYGAIRIGSTGTFGTQACDGISIVGNLCEGYSSAPAIEVDVSVLTPTNYVIRDNIAGQGLAATVKVGNAPVAPV